MKIHWLSNAPWSTTGYGNQTRTFVSRLHNMLGHDLSVTAFWGLEGSPLNMGDIKVYPKGFHPYGQDIVAANAKYEKADILISLIDAWVCDADMMQLHKMRWCPWFPVDSEPLPPPVTRQVTKAYRRLVFSHFAEKMLDQAGLDHIYIPHGVDTKQFAPLDKVESRKSIGLPEDAYIIGMVAANKGNPSRKAFCEQITAFQTLKQVHNDAVLYLHTHDGSNGHNASINLIEFVSNMGLKFGVDVFICGQHQYHLGYSDDYMAKAYSAMDVLTNVSTGEGFGIPIVEAQACGTPVIVGGWTSMQELCFSGRMVDRKDAAPWYTSLGAYQFLPRFEAIAEQYFEEYEHPSSKEKAREGALPYDADLVTETYWKEALDKIAEDIGEGDKLELVQF